jgi:hypothetical protein
MDRTKNPNITNNCVMPKGSKHNEIQTCKCGNTYLSWEGATLFHLEQSLMGHIPTHVHDICDWKQWLLVSAELKIEFRTCRSYKNIIVQCENSTYKIISTGREKTIIAIFRHVLISRIVTSPPWRSSCPMIVPANYTTFMVQ